MSKEYPNKRIVRITEEVLLDKLKYLVYDMGLVLDSAERVDEPEQHKLKLILNCSHNIAGYRNICTSLISDKTTIEKQYKRIKELEEEVKQLGQALQKISEVSNA